MQLYKLLIVEDEAFIRRGLVRTVDWESMGFEVIGDAENGVKALEFIEKEKPDLVMTDIRMPIMDGLELMSEITARYPEINMIVLSGYGDFSYAQHAISCGVLAYILKPTKDIEIKKTFARVKKILDGEEETRRTQGLSRAPASSEDPVISKAKDYINTHFSDHILLDDVADFVHMNPTYFSSYFKDKSGEFFKDYLLKVRMENAKNLALETGLTTYNIALMVGYEDSRYFAALFKKTYGKSITEMRRQIGK